MQRIGEGKDEPGGKDILTSVGDPIINLYQRRVANSHSLYKGETKLHWSCPVPSQAWKESS